MKKKILIGLSAAALFLSVNNATLACSGQEQHYPGQYLEKIVEKLHLTAEQKTKIKVIREKAHQDIRAKFQELGALRLQINQLVVAPSVDDKKLDDVVNQQKDIWGSIIKLKVQEKRDIGDVLTAEQKVTFSDMLVKFEEKHMKDKKD